MKCHRDHMTATCPHFQARNDYRGGHWIQCTMGRRGFSTAWERNQHYKAICCEGGKGCELINIKKVRGPKL